MTTGRRSGPIDDDPSARAGPTLRGATALDGEDVTALPRHALVGKGLPRAFRIARELGSLGVRDNLRPVPGGQPGRSLRTACFRPSRIGARVSRDN